MYSDGKRYEGCGKEGPLRSIIFAEFHHTAGPMVRCQAPSSGSDIITKDVFEAISVYIIPKQQLARTPLTVNVLERKICGYPIILEDKKYKRNQFMFNVCFVCYPWSRTVQYEPALIKLSKFLVDLEKENEFLSREENTESIQKILDKVFADINETGGSTVQIGDNTLQLKVTSSAPDPPQVHDWDVPVLMVNPDPGNEEWDLTTQQLLSFVNGINHVAKIAAEADVESNLVKAAVQNLVYHRVVDIVPIFMYSNVYCVTPNLRDIREDINTRTEFMSVIQRPSASGIFKTSFRDVYEMVCAFNHHTTVNDICQRFSPKQKLDVDECRLVQYLVLKGILRRIHKYPVYVPDNSGVSSTVLGQSNSAVGAACDLYPYFTGQKHYDEICCKTGLSARKLDEKIENDPNVYVLRI